MTYPITPVNDSVSLAANRADAVLNDSLFVERTLACAIGDSITAGTSNGNSYFEKLIKRSGGAIKKLGNFGVGGATTSAILEKQVPLAIASGARLCFVQAGTNTVATSQETARQDMINILRTLRSNGVEPVVVSLLPRNDGSAGEHVKFNIWLGLYCRFNNFQFVNVFSKLSTVTGAYTPGYILDTVHPNTVGANIIADAVLSYIRQPFIEPFVALSDTAADNYSAYPSAMSFGGVSAVDVAPTGYSKVGAGGVNSVIAPVGQEIGNYLRTVITAGTDVGIRTTAVTLASLGWENTDRFAWGATVRWTDTSQALGVNAQLTSPTFAAGDVGPLPMSLEKGGATGDVVSFYTEAQAISGTSISGYTGGTGTGTLDINRPILVNLTKLGFA